MNPPPGIVHAAADLRREALLAEAVDARRARFTRETTAAERRGPSALSMANRVVAVMGWVIDCFEPIPGRLPDEPERQRP